MPSQGPMNYIGGTSFVKTALDSESEELLPADLSYHAAPRRQIQWLRLKWWLLSVVLTSLTTLLLVIKSRPTWLLNSYPEIERLASLNVYSPVFHEIDVRFERVRQDGQLWWNTTQKYRQDPSPETDEAWLDLLGGSANRMKVSKDSIVKAGIDLDMAVPWPGDSTGNTFVAEVNVFHLLHCLDQLRQATFIDYYLPLRPINPLYWTHYYHCLDMIRQDIMCRASFDLVPLVWQEHQTPPFPHFSIDRTCMNWDDILAYRRRHQLSPDEAQAMQDQKKPLGVKEVPTPNSGLQILENLREWMLLNSSDDTWVEQSEYGRSSLDMMLPIRSRPNEQKFRQSLRPHKASTEHVCTQDDR